MLSKIHHKIVSIKKTTLIPKSWYSFNEKSICKDTDLMLSLKQRKKLYRESASLRFISNLKTLENQEHINAVMKDEKYVKMTPINLQCQMIKFGKSTKKLTATQSMSYIMGIVKFVTKNRLILGKQ